MARFGRLHCNVTLATLMGNLYGVEDSLEEWEPDKWYEEFRTDLEMLREHLLRKDSKALLIPPLKNSVSSNQDEYLQLENNAINKSLEANGLFQDKYQESLADIAKTLALEPRHFGSLAGRANIRMRQLKPELARQNIIEALKVHPFLKERRMFPSLRRS